MAKRTAITEFLPDPHDLIGIEYDRAASTAIHRVYRAPSDRDPAVTYRVVLNDVTEAGGYCPCLGFTHNGHCKHVNRCYRFERREWWIRLMRDWPDDELMLVYALHEAHLLADNGVAEDIAAIEAIVCIQTAREQQEAA